MHSENVYAERAPCAIRRSATSPRNKRRRKLSTPRARKLAGKYYLSPGMTEHLLRRAGDPSMPQFGSSVDDLTDRELEVFRLIGQGVQTQESPTNCTSAAKTIETHRDRIKKKLDMKDANELLREATLWVSANQ